MARMKPRVEVLAVEKKDYDCIILQCSLPCDWRNSPNGPVQEWCKLWDHGKKECGKKGFWYSVILNDCAMIWESNNENVAKEMDTVLSDIAERNGIEYKSCFLKGTKTKK